MTTAFHRPRDFSSTPCRERPCCVRMARNRAPRVLAYSDGMSVGPRPVGLFSKMVTLSDGRPRGRQGQAEWQKAVELTRDAHLGQPVPAVAAGPGKPCMAGLPALTGRSARPLRALIRTESRYDVILITSVTWVMPTTTRARPPPRLRCLFGAQPAGRPKRARQLAKETGAATPPGGASPVPADTVRRSDVL